MVVNWETLVVRQEHYPGWVSSRLQSIVHTYAFISRYDKPGEHGYKPMKNRENMTNQTLSSGGSKLAPWSCEAATLPALPPMHSFLYLFITYFFNTFQIQ